MFDENPFHLMSVSFHYIKRKNRDGNWSKWKKKAISLNRHIMYIPLGLSLWKAYWYL